MREPRTATTPAATTTPATTRRTRIDPWPTALRLKRFKVGVTLLDLAREAGLTLTRASLVERGLRAGPDDVRALEAALRRLAKTTTPPASPPQRRRLTHPRTVTAAVRP